MSDLICECGCKVGDHMRDMGWCTGCQACYMDFETSLIAAQRAAAIEHLRALGACIELGTNKRDWRVFRVYEAIAAYRAIGVLPKPKERKP